MYGAQRRRHAEADVLAERKQLVKSLNYQLIAVLAQLNGSRNF